MALLASAAMLAIAHAFETFGRLAPCTLCLREREIFWAALAIAGVAVVLRFSPVRVGATRLANVLLVLAFTYSALVAGYHAGAEWKWWPGPTTCSGGAGHVNAADLTAFLKGARAAMPACDKAAWVFLGISMAGWNCLISLGLAALSVLAAFRREPAHD